MSEETSQTRRLRKLVQMMIVLNQRMALAYQRMALACLLCLGGAGIIAWLPLDGGLRLLLYTCVLAVVLGAILIWTLRPLWGRQ